MEVCVSVIIVTYNTKDLTCQCLESVKAQTKDVSYEIILVDNASTDGSREYFGQRDDLVYIYSDENLGFGKANNLGFSKASGKYLLLLNSDTVLNNNAIKYFYDFMEAAPAGIACCGGFLRDSNLKIIHSYGRFHTFWNAIYEWCLFPYLWRVGFKLGKYDYPIQKTEDHYEVDYVTGADLFIRKSMAEKYGLFDPDFFMYYEDADLCRRYHEAGYKCVLIEAPQVIHLESRSSKDNMDGRMLVAVKSLFVYMKKHMNRFEYACFRVLFNCLNIKYRA